MYNNSNGIDDNYAFVLLCQSDVIASIGCTSPAMRHQIVLWLQVTALVFGILLFLLSLPTAYFLEERAKILFAPAPALSTSSRDSESNSSDVALSTGIVNVNYAYGSDGTTPINRTAADQGMPPVQS